MMNFQKELEELKNKAIDSIGSLIKLINIKDQMIDSQSKLIKLYEQLLKDVLLSQDITWEEKNLGHDWKDLMMTIRGILKDDKDNNRTIN